MRVLRVTGVAVIAGILMSAAAYGQTVPAAQGTSTAQGTLIKRGDAQAATSAATAASNLTFDVASVRPSAPLDPVKMRAAIQSGHMPNFGAQVNASRATYSYMTLKALIANAYGVKEYQVTGPDWLNSERFDIVANLPEGASKDDAPKMLQALLEDRFKLEAHSEKQEHPVLALVVGKDGPKMKASSGPAPEPIDPNTPLKPGEMSVNTADGPARMTMNKNGAGATVNMGAKGIITYSMDPQSMTIHINSTRTTMAALANMLTQMTQMGGTGGRQVVDMTGLKGSYEVSLDFSMASMMAAARAQGMNGTGGGEGAASVSAMPDASDPGGGAASAYQAVEKLGLKLEPRKAMVEQVVVEHAEKTPTPN